MLLVSVCNAATAIRAWHGREAASVSPRCRVVGASGVGAPVQALWEKNARRVYECNAAGKHERREEKEFSVLQFDGAGGCQ